MLKVNVHFYCIRISPVATTTQLHYLVCLTCLIFDGYSAGIGVLNAARKTMARMLGNNELAFEGARSQFWVVDAKVSDGIMFRTVLTSFFCTPHA